MKKKAAAKKPVIITEKCKEVRTTRIYQRVSIYEKLCDRRYGSSYGSADKPVPTLEGLQELAAQAVTIENQLSANI